MNCPSCGNIMIKKTATRGKHIGENFWGCSNWPTCKGIVNIINTDGNLYKVKIGSKVEVRFLSSNENKIFKIIELYRKSIQHTGVPFQYETKEIKEVINPANPENDSVISNEAPLGKALMGSRVGETICYDTPEGKQKVLLIKIL